MPRPRAGDAVAAAAMTGEAPLRILVIDENPIRRAILDAGLKDAGFTNITLLSDTQGLLDRIYAVDPDVTDEPRAAHILKTFALDQELDVDEVGLRRFIRRGIPYGMEHDPDRDDDGRVVGKADRVLCFVC